MQRSRTLRRFFWRAFLAFDGLLIMLFIAGYTARYIHPRHVWWLQLIAIGLPYLSMAVLATTVVTALVSKWKLLSIHLLFCLLMLFRFVSFERFSNREGNTAQHLKIMTFNAPYTYWKDASGRLLPRAVREHAMETLIEREQPRLIALQGVALYFVEEPERISAHPHILKLLDLGYFSRKPEAPVSQNFSQPVLSQIPLEEHTRVDIERSIDLDRTASVTRARFRWQGGEVALYNLHLKSFQDGSRPWEGNLFRWLNPVSWRSLWRYGKDYRTRAYEAEQVRRMLQQETLPFVVCGDLNSTPHNWSYWHIARGLKDAFKIAGEGWGATYHTRLPIFRIDYILASAEFQVHSAHVADATFSDHLPLVATLSWRER